MPADQDPPRIDGRKKVWLDAEKLVEYIVDYKSKHGGERPAQWRILIDFQWSEGMLEARHDMARAIARARNIQL